MARIRTIKPEFPHSESIGRISRDARLLFIQLWTICDDSGRSRGNSRMLASLLFPYDDDAPSLIDGWMDELEREGCVVRYEVEGQTYLEICNWLNHQKIDKPSQSKIPPFSESSRILAEPSRKIVQDQGVDQGVDLKPKSPPAPVAIPSSEKKATRLPDDFDLPVEWGEWAEKERGLTPLQVVALSDQFRDYWVSKPGKDGRKLDWEATWRNWVRGADLRRVAA